MDAQLGPKSSPEPKSVRKPSPPALGSAHRTSLFLLGLLVKKSSVM